jgi:phosphatidylglycerophosphate synthase
MPPTRRPLKTRETSWARALARWLAARRVAPNQISLASIVFAVLGAGAMLAAVFVSGGMRAGLFVAAAVCIQLRLLCNLLDGMVAVEGGLGSPSGEVYNEVPDRIADPLLIVPAGYACGLPFGPELAWMAALLALLTAYIRALGSTLGLAQGFEGPMAKPHRMAAMSVGLIVAALVTPWAYEGPVLMLTLAVILLGAILTAARRTRAILNALEAR